MRHVPGPPSDATACRTSSGDVVVFDGYLFDRTAREAGAPISEAALVASEHGGRPEAFIRELSGAFAVVIWDASRRRLVVGRDAMGLTSCFYWWNGRTLLVSASLDAILARREVAATFDRAVIAEYLQDRMSSHQVHETFYQDVRRLPPAHVLRVERGMFEMSRYWDPVPPGFVWATREEISRFDAVLERAVRSVSVGGWRQHRAERGLRLRRRGDAGCRPAPWEAAPACRVAEFARNRVRRRRRPGRSGARARHAAAPPDARRCPRRREHRRRCAPPLSVQPKSSAEPVAGRVHRPLPVRLPSRARARAHGHGRRRAAERRRSVRSRPSRSARPPGALALLPSLPAHVVLSGLSGHAGRPLGSCGGAGAPEAGPRCPRALEPPGPRLDASAPSATRLVRMGFAEPPRSRPAPRASPSERGPRRSGAGRAGLRRQGP